MNNRILKIYAGNVRFCGHRKSNMAASNIRCVDHDRNNIFVLLNMNMTIHEIATAATNALSAITCLDAFLWLHCVFGGTFIPWLTQAQALQVSLLVAKGYPLFLGQATQQQCTMRLLPLVHAMPCIHEPDSEFFLNCECVKRIGRWVRVWLQVP